MLDKAVVLVSPVCKANMPLGPLLSSHLSPFLYHCHYFSHGDGQGIRMSEVAWVHIRSIKVCFLFH
jgi:hypothetical protein